MGPKKGHCRKKRAKEEFSARAVVSSLGLFIQWISRNSFLLR
jgi:hypothetical protein